MLVVFVQFWGHQCWGPAAGVLLQLLSLGSHFVLLRVHCNPGPECHPGRCLQVVLDVWAQLPVGAQHELYMYCSYRLYISCTIMAFNANANAKRFAVRHPVPYNKGSYCCCRLCIAA
jgi:hypothetical protein